jgi:hypothetical protein
LSQGGEKLLGRAALHRSFVPFEDLFHVPAAMKNGSDLQRLRLGPIHDQIRVDGEKLHILVRQILAAVPGIRSSREKGYSFEDGGFNAVGYRNAALFFDVTPDFDEIQCCLGRKNVAHAHLGLVFQFRHVSIQLIFRDSTATVELLDTALDLCVDCFPVLQEPTVLLFLGLKQTDQYFLNAAGAGGLNLFLDSGLKGRIVDFDVHGLNLQQGIPLSSSQLRERYFSRLNYGPVG